MYACYDEVTPWARTRGYRLPTRAEWLSVAHLGAPQGELNLEAIRATSHELSFNGPITSTRRKTKGSEESVAPSRPAPIASGAPNLLGVYDLFGGVREWVNDATSNKAVAMGGSFLTTPREALKIRPLTPQIDLEYGERDLGVRLVFQGR